MILNDMTGVTGKKATGSETGGVFGGGLGRKCGKFGASGRIQQ
jgi:hypothetical protein